MHRKGFKADPLRNEGDMKVFYCLASRGHGMGLEVGAEGIKFIRFEPTLTRMAGCLKIKPPSVLEHLENLMKVGFVKRGRKKGRSQPYEANWGRVIRKFWEVSATQEYAVTLREKTPWTRKEKADLRKLRKSKLIRAMIKEYFEVNLLKNLIRPIGGPNFLEVPSFYRAVWEFESEVARYKFEEGEVENKEAHRLLKKWQDYLTRVYSLSGIAARDSIAHGVGRGVGERRFVRIPKSA